MLVRVSSPEYWKRFVSAKLYTAFNALSIKHLSLGLKQPESEYDRSLPSVIEAEKLGSPAPYLLVVQRNNFIQCVQRILWMKLGTLRAVSVVLATGAQLVLVSPAPGTVKCLKMEDEN